jgi:ABC-type Zn uptake system ZnuABC Zn-binding protein ZnuA
VTAIEDNKKTLDTKAEAVKSAFAKLDSAFDTKNQASITQARKDVVAAKKAFHEYFAKTFRPALKSAIDELRKTNEAS